MAGDKKNIIGKKAILSVGFVIVLIVGYMIFTSFEGKRDSSNGIYPDPNDKGMYSDK